MKKNFKSKSYSEPSQAEPDIAVLIHRMQQQLVSLENKIDTLISQSSEKPFERKHFSKPFRRPDHERNFTQVICADCKKECEVPFRPSGDRPVYCKECFSKRKGGSSFKGRESRRPDERKKPNFRRRKERGIR